MKKFLTFLLIIATLGVFSNIFSQEKDSKPKLDSEAKKAREYALRILDEMEDILREYYYDPNFRGINLKTRIEAAKERVKTLQFNWQMYRVLVQVLMEFNDSHTRMFLPPRDDHFEYGFGLQMIGDECFITSIKQDSDAYKQGIRIGDQVLLFGRYTPNRRDLWKMIYVAYKLDPADTLNLKIRNPEGDEKSLTVKAKTMTEKEFRTQQKNRKDKKKAELFKCQEVNKEIIACKLYSFVVERNDIEKMMKQANNYPKFILDLRGNGGGYVFIEQYFLSYFFDREVKILDLVTKRKSEARFTKPVNERQYKGEVAVLIDSNSASAAEITARVLQLEKRAKIYGDTSSGSVMTSISIPFTSIISASAYAALVRVGMSVTIGDVIMRDGSRLENIGVIPDEILQPSPIALSTKVDPVLAYSAIRFGAKVTPEQAGNYYFLTEKDEYEEDDTDDSQN